MKGLDRSGVQLTIRTAEAAYEVGQPIRVRATAVARRDSGIRSASAYLVASLGYGAPHVTSTATYTSVSRPRPAVVSVSRIALGLPAAIRAGDTAECEALLPNLATVPSRGVRMGPHVLYSVCAQVDLAEGGVTRKAAQVSLLSPRSLYQENEGTAMRAPRHPSGKCDLELDLPALYARPGETLRGVLHVRPRGNVQARRVQVSLVRVEWITKEKPTRTVSYDDYRRQDLKLPVSRTRHRKSVMRTRHITLTGPSEIPFSAQLPGNAIPTMLNRYLSTRWYIEASVTYGLFSHGDACGRELNVYNGR